MAERVGRPGFENVHPEDAQSARDMLATVLAGPGATARAELRLRTADDQWRHLELTIRNLTHLPGVAGLVVNARDVTDRRNTERALRESEERLFHAQKMDAIGRLAGGVAHDFNNLLTAIRGHAELLLADLPEGDAIRDDIHEIEDAARRATGLTRQLLAFSRKQVLQPRALDLNAVVQDMERMVGRLIGEHITLVASLSPELASIRADRSQIEQVVLNLAVNARDAMPAGGRLLIETAVIDTPDGSPHPEVRAGRWVMLRVSDTGVGMDAATSAQAFEPFFTTKPPGQGTGLGLSTVYGVVRQSGGHVWAESMTADAGRETGTCMTVLLPAVELAPEVAEPRPVAVRAPGGEETVALVEDEKSVRELAQRILTRGGYRVIAAEDGQSGLKLIAGFREPIHLLLTDVVMPGMGGRELVERVCEMRPGIRVLYMSGYAEDAVVRDGALAPGSGFLEKPFSPDMLLARVRELLDGAGTEPAAAER
jgi:signal transduction histidine kinase/ActR/RegA family two-component response regulator